MAEMGRYCCKTIFGPRTKNRFRSPQGRARSLAAQGRRIESEAAPIRYVADLLGVDTDSERSIRWLIALMVLCCDPLAIALTAAASARR
jgi:hypothetical protein